MTRDQLKQICPAIKDKNLQYADYISIATAKWSTDAKAAFVAQLAHESGAFNYVREIASGRAYEGRKDLGNIMVGDGMKFKGRGLIQITGRSNYWQLSWHLFNDDRLIENPEILEQPNYAVLSAVWFWNSRKLSEVMNQPKTWTREFKGKKYDRFEWVTLRINGGQNGIAERKEYFARALNIFSKQQGLV